MENHRRHAYYPRKSSARIYRDVLFTLSNPQTVVATADANGNWVYTTATPLESGTHNVIVSATDPTTGKQLTSTSTFVVASGANETATQSAMPISGDISTTYIILILGSLLLLGGLFYPTTTRAYGKYS